MTRAITPSTRMMLTQLAPFAAVLLAVIVASALVWEIVW